MVVPLVISQRQGLHHWHMGKGKAPDKCPSKKNGKNGNMPA